MSVRKTGNTRNHLQFDYICYGTDRRLLAASWYFVDQASHELYCTQICAAVRSSCATNQPLMSTYSLHFCDGPAMANYFSEPNTYQCFSIIPALAEHAFLISSRPLHPDLLDICSPLALDIIMKPLHSGTCRLHLCLRCRSTYMWQTDHIVMIPQPLIPLLRWRLLSMTIQPYTPYKTFVQRSRQSLLIHNASSRRIDQEHIPLHLLVANSSPRLRYQWHMDCDNIANLQ